MTVTLQERNGQVILTINGEIDTNEAEELKKKFLEVIPMIKDTLVLDFSGMTFIGSSGIGKILSLYKNLAQQNKNIKIVNMDENIYHLFISFKLDKLFDMGKKNG